MIEEISNLIIDCFKKGNKVLTFGVGGNAANAIHFAAELAGKYEQYEDPLPCIDLCSNPSVLTAITNDFGWDHVFERQIRALVKPGDAVIAFSISTKAKYLINAFRETMNSDCKFVLISGSQDRDFGLVDIHLSLGSNSTPWVQEEQLRIIHQICGLV